MINSPFCEGSDNSSPGDEMDSADRSLDKIQMIPALSLIIFLLYDAVWFLKKLFPFPRCKPPYDLFTSFSGYGSRFAAKNG
jgi:flagellar biogenesis protein FliO